MKNILSFIKNRIVFCISFLLALISCFFVIPSKEYLGYIDWNTLSILFALMATIQGLNNLGIFKTFGSFLCSKCKSTRSLSIALIFMSFISSMFITNDVALLTFVPFSLYLLTTIPDIPLWIPLYTVILQTIAANTGSMLTPVGNPQNLFIYEQSGMNLLKFTSILLPYTIFCGILLFACSMIIPKVKIQQQYNVNTVKESKTFHLTVYILLFIICLISVVRIIPKTVTALITLIVLLIIDRETLKKVDYFLLLTFVCFFIFSGNLSNIQFIKDFLQKTLNNRECISSMLLSQVVSNVPATLMLYPFTENIKELLLGVNFGGLGTLIGSLASLISFNIYCQFNNDEKIKLPSQGKYLFYFTILNIIFIIFLFLLKFIIK